MPKIIKKVTTKKEKPVKAKKPVAKEKEPVVLPGEPEVREEMIDPKVKRYYEAVGRRKTAIAQVRLYTVKPFEEDLGKVTVNGKPYKEYFTRADHQQTVEAALRKIKSLNRFEVTVKVRGGGITAQAEAIRHGVARALVEFNADFRKKLKRSAYLKRDPRMKERKKFGLLKARRAPQWAKR